MRTKYRDCEKKFPPQTMIEKKIEELFANKRCFHKAYAEESRSILINLFK